MPQGAQEGIRRGMYLFRAGKKGDRRVQLMGSGAILREVIAAADLLEQDFEVAVDVWSATSFTELRRDGEAASRNNRLNPDSTQTSWVEQCLEGHPGPVVAATDYVSSFPDQIRAFIPRDQYIVLGTDGFGRSDTRKNLRWFFEVDRHQVAYAALYALYRENELELSALLEARERLGIDPGKPDPLKG